MVDKSKLKGISVFIPVPFYYYVKERSVKCGVSMAKYLSFLISKDIENYLNCKEVKPK